MIKIVLLKVNLEAISCLNFNWNYIKICRCNFIILYFRGKKKNHVYNYIIIRKLFISNFDIYGLILVVEITKLLLKNCLSYPQKLELG